jgi:hypothetical protein
MNRLNLQSRARILGCLTEGNSLRATTRMVGCSINTVTKLLVDLGTACGIYQNEVFRDLTCKRIQVDEIWSFCYAKQKNVAPNRAGVFGQGDVYTWVAIDADTKLVPSWLVGTRDAEYAQVFISDLASRIKGRTQLTSDGHKAYLRAVDDAFWRGRGLQHVGEALRQS